MGTSECRQLYTFSTLNPAQFLFGPLSHPRCNSTSNYPTADTYMCMPHIQKDMIRKHRTPRQLCFFVSRPSKRSQPCKVFTELSKSEFLWISLEKLQLFPIDLGTTEEMEGLAMSPHVIPVSLSNWIWPGCAQCEFIDVCHVWGGHPLFQRLTIAFPDGYGQELCFSSTWTLRANKLCFYSLFLNRSLSFLCFINFASSIFLTAVKKPCQTQNKLYMYIFIYMLKKNKPVDLEADASLSQVRFSISSSIFTDCEGNWVHAGTGVLINPH